MTDRPVGLTLYDFSQCVNYLVHLRMFVIYYDYLYLYWTTSRSFTMDNVLIVLSHNSVKDQRHKTQSVNGSSLLTAN